MRIFFEAHYGDIISIYLFHLGVGMLVASALRPGLTDLNKVGWSLIVASMGTLKFKGYLNGGTNGTTTVSPPSTPTGPVL